MRVSGGGGGFMLDLMPVFDVTLGTVRTGVNGNHTDAF
jgi:hypothetical protein